jgi:hypothetical protein
MADFIPAKVISDLLCVYYPWFLVFRYLLVLRNLPFLVVDLLELKRVYKLGFRGVRMVLCSPYTVEVDWASINLFKIGFLFYSTSRNTSAPPPILYGFDFE